jgi:hypothetical protein
MHRILVGLACVWLVVSGCIGSAGPADPEAGTAQAANATGTADGAPALGTVEETFELTWTQARAYDGQVTDDNCVWLLETDDFRIVNGTVTVEYRPGDLNTSRDTLLALFAGDNLREHNEFVNLSGPTTHTVDVSGWNITFEDFTVDFQVGFESPKGEPVYVGHENSATVHVDWTYEGTMGEFELADCTR